MPNEATTPANAARWITRMCAMLVLAGGVVSALGWILGVERLTDWFGDGPTIKFNASLCLIFASLGVLFAAYYPRYSLLVRMIGGFVAVVGLATLIQFVFGISLGIDTLFFTEPPGALATYKPNRMGIPASSSFLLLGAALIFSTIERARYTAALMGLAPLLIALLSLAGYSFGASALYTLPLATGIALQTAAMIALLAIGLIASIPDHGLACHMLSKDGGGIMLRRSLPLLLVLIYAFSWLLLSGVKGGLYDPSFGSAIRVIFESVLLTSVLWWTAKHVTASEEAGIEAVKALARNETHQRVAETQEAERKRISRDLHDHLGQEVTALRFTLEHLCNADLDLPHMISEVKGACSKMEKLDGELSNIAWQLRVPEITEEGLTTSLRRLGAECSAIHNIDFDLHAPANLPALPADVETNIFRIVQEAMNNAVKHASAKRIGVVVDQGNGDIRLAVEDDGHGRWDPDARAHKGDGGGFGLTAMRERSALIGGTFEIEATPGSGTTVLVQIPLNHRGAKPSAPPPVP